VDGAIYLQAAYLIAHGHLDPSSSALGHAFWQDHSSFAYWPLALLELLDPHGLTILWTRTSRRWRRGRSPSAGS